MPKLIQLETDANVSNYTPEAGNITTFFTEENGAVKLKYKKANGEIAELSGGSSGGSSGGADPTVPDSCISYLGSNGCIYIRTGSGITVGGLDRNAAEDREGFEAYGPMAAADIGGAVVSSDGVWLQWAGLMDFANKWTLHTLVSRYGAGSGDVYAWGFSGYESTYGDEYTTDGLDVYLMSNSVSGTTYSINNPQTYSSGHALAALFPAAYTWDGPGGYAYGLDPSFNKSTSIFYAYDAEVGMPGSKSVVGDILYLGKPPAKSGASGMLLGGFALELNPEGYTDAATYFSPLLDKSKYNNL